MKLVFPPICFTFITTLFLVFLNVSSIALASEIYISEDAASIQPDQIHLSLLRDQSGALSFKEAIEAYQKGRFTSFDSSPNLGYTKDTVWVALSLLPNYKIPKEWLLQLEPSTLDFVKLYSFTGNDINNPSIQIGGDVIPVSKRSLPNRNPTFRLELNDKVVTLLLQIKTSSQMTIFPSLNQQTISEQSEKKEMLLIGAYYGFMLTAIIFSITAWLTVRRSPYFLYVSYVLFMTLFWLSYNGLIGFYLIPEAPLLANQLLGVFLNVSIVIGNTFFKSLFAIKDDAVITNRLIISSNIFAIVSAVCIMTGLFSIVLPLSLTSVIISSGVLATNAIYLLLRTDKDRYIFAGAYILYAIANNIVILMNFGLLPVNTFTLYEAQAAQMIHILAIHIGLYLEFRKFEHQTHNAEYQVKLLNKQRELDANLHEEQLQLFHIIEHEIRTPISIINACTQSLKLLDKDGSNQSDKNNRYEKIHRAINRLELLVSISRMGISDQWKKGHSEHINPIEILKKIISRHENGKNRIKLSLSSTPSFKILFNEEYLEFVFNNLIDNATKYSAEFSSIVIESQTETRQETNGISISFGNQTSHMSMEHLDRLFDKYTRFDEGKNEPGLGMGLYLIKQLIENEHGQVTADIPEPNYIRITIWLPQSV